MTGLGLVAAAGGNPGSLAAYLERLGLDWKAVVVVVVLATLLAGSKK